MKLLLTVALRTKRMISLSNYILIDIINELDTNIHEETMADGNLNKEFLRYSHAFLLIVLYYKYKPKTCFLLHSCFHAKFDSRLEYIKNFSSREFCCFCHFYSQEIQL